MTRRATSLSRLGCAAALLAGLAAAAGALRIDLPPETASLAPGKDVELANARCLTCHSAEYISTQPRLPRAFWKGAVQKMREKFGAEIPETETEALVDYLTAAYGAPGPGGSNGARAAAPAVRAIGAAAAADGAALAKRYGCLACHAVDHKITGPAFRDIAAKYKRAPDGRGRVAHQILQGGAGQWGSVRMPAFSQVPPADVRALSDWILGQDSGPR